MPANTPNLTQYADRAIGTLTDTELDAISEDLAHILNCEITREGFDDFSLTWITWVWTPGGWSPDPAGKCTHWPLARYLPLSHVVELATHLHKARPAF